MGPGDRLLWFQETGEKREKGERESDLKSALAQDLRVRRHEGRRRGQSGQWPWHSVPAWVISTGEPYAALEREMLPGSLWGGETAGSVLDKLSTRGSLGHPEMKILNGQLKLWVWRSREKNGIETAWHTARAGALAGVLGGH